MARAVVLPSADSNNNGNEVSAQAGLSSSRLETEGSRHSVGRCESVCDHSHDERVEVVFPQNNAHSVGTKEINVKVAGQDLTVSERCFQRPMFAEIY